MQFLFELCMFVVRISFTEPNEQLHWKVQVDSSTARPQHPATRRIRITRLQHCMFRHVASPRKPQRAPVTHFLALVRVPPSLSLSLSPPLSIYMYIHIRLCLCFCVCIYIYIYTYAFHIHIHTLILLYDICTHICSYLHMYICIHVYTYHLVADTI